MRGQVEENLRRLGRDHLDLVNLRVLAAQDSVAEHFGALAELRDAGLVRHPGISGVRPQQLAEAQTVAPVVCVRNRFGIGARDDDELVRLCAAQRIAYVPFFGTAGERGAAGITETETPGVRAVAGAHGASPAQVRPAWTLRQGEHVPAIPGTGDPDHLVENLAAGALRLSEEEMALLDEDRLESRPRRASLL